MVKTFIGDTTTVPYRKLFHIDNLNSFFKIYFILFQGPGGPPPGPGQPGPPPGQENLNALQRAIDSMEEKGMQEDPR